MKRTYTSLLYLILSLCARAQTTQPAQPPHIITSDLANFWNAYDSVTATTDSAAQVRDIQHLYLDKASDGLKDMIKIRHWNARIFQLIIKRYPAFWTSIRPKIMNIQGQLPIIEGLLTRYEQLFPAFQTPEICFTVGYLGTGGTTTQTRVLIGSEIAAADSTVNTTGLNPFLANFFKENKGIEYLVAHELTHTQQKGGDMEDRRPTNLLGFCLAEGMCDFMAERLLQKPLPQPYILYGRQHDRELWAAFRDSLHGRNIGPWLYNSGNTKLKMADLGYYMGYAICTAYYKKNKDKKKAIADIITLDLESPATLDDFLARSGYGN